jgi:hypothetical protein
VESEGNAWFCRSPELYVDHGAAERRLVLRTLLAELRWARKTRAEWYVWVVSGRPALPESEYERVGRQARPGGPKR